MRKYFTVKAKFTTTTDNGYTKLSKNVEVYDAWSYTETESRALKQNRCYNNYQIQNIKTEPFEEIIHAEAADGDERKWYKVKVNYITIRENNGEERINKVVFLVEALSTDEASDRLHEHLKSTMIDYEITGVQETDYTAFHEYVGERLTDETR